MCSGDRGEGVETTELLTSRYLTKNWWCMQSTVHAQRVRPLLHQQHVRTPRASGFGNQNDWGQEKSPTKEIAPEYYTVYREGTGWQFSFSVGSFIDILVL